MRPRFAVAGLLALCACLVPPGLAAAQAPPQTPAPAPSPATPQAPAPVALKPSPPATDEPRKAPPADAIQMGKPVRADAIHRQRQAAKLYLEGAKLIEKQQPEAAWKLLKQAAQLAPENPTYAHAAELARQSTVTQLVEQSSRQRAAGAAADAAQSLQRAFEIDPTNPVVLEHLDRSADRAAPAQAGVAASSAAADAAGSASALDTLADGSIVLAPRQEKHTFHLRSSSRQVLEEVFRAYGIEAAVNDSVQSRPVRLDLDDATFAQAAHVLSLLTQSFYEPLDPHRVLVARDTRENRLLYQRQELETLYLPGLDEKALTEVSNIARNVFETQQAQTEASAGTLTIRAPAKTLAAFNRTMAQLEDGRSQVDLHVEVIQLSHITTRETGATFFQQSGVYNLASEASSILSQNQAAVQQIIASGLVPNANGIANQIKIILILLAAGQLTGPPFNQGLLPFGNGLTASLLTVSPATLTMSLNSSDTRILDDIHLQLGDDEEGTFKIGERYPIETSSFSSAALPAIAGISTSAISAATQTVPQVEYQDIGLTLKATPKVMRSNDVAVTLDLKITAIGGTSLNDIPVLNNQQVSGVLTLQAGETALLLSDLSRTESRALSGLPGIGDVPGLEDISDVQRNQNVARLLVLVTPEVVRNAQQAGHSPVLMVDKLAGGRPGIP